MARRTPRTIIKIASQEDIGIWGGNFGHLLTNQLSAQLSRWQRPPTGSGTLIIVGSIEQRQATAINHISKQTPSGHPRQRIAPFRRNAITEYPAGGKAKNHPPPNIASALGDKKSRHIPQYHYHYGLPRCNGSRSGGAVNLLAGVVLPPESQSGPVLNH